MTAREYAELHLSQDIREIQTTHRLNILPELSVYEKAILYKYSDDGYENLNEMLRVNKGINVSIFGVLLEKILSKLPDYQGVIYRGTVLIKSEFEQYFSEDSINNKRFLKIHSFFSTSKSKNKAYEFCNGEYSILFQIFSRKGKEIEKIAKYPTEREVLFTCNTEFEIIDFQEPEYDNTYYLVTIKEV